MAENRCTKHWVPGCFVQMDAFLREILIIECSNEGRGQAWCKVRSAIAAKNAKELFFFLSHEKDWIFTVLSCIRLIITDCETYSHKPIARVCIPYTAFRDFLSTDFILDILHLLKKKCSVHTDLKIDNNETWQKYMQVISAIGTVRSYQGKEFANDHYLFSLMNNMQVAVIYLTDAFKENESTVAYKSFVDRVMQVAASYFECIRFLDKEEEKLPDIPFLTDFFQSCRNVLANFWFLTGLYEVNGMSKNITEHFRSNMNVFKGIYQSFVQHKLIWDHEYDAEFFMIIEELSSTFFKEHVSYYADDRLLEEICKVNSSFRLTPTISSHISFFQNPDINNCVSDNAVVIIDKGENEDRIKMVTESIIQISNEIQSKSSGSVIYARERLVIQEDLLGELASCYGSENSKMEMDIYVQGAKKRKFEMDDCLDTCIKKSRFNKMQALSIGKSLLFQEKAKNRSLKFIHDAEREIIVHQDRGKRFSSSVKKAVLHIRNVIDIYMKMIATGENLMETLKDEFVKCHGEIPYSESKLSDAKNNPCLFALSGDTISTCGELDTLRNFFKSCIRKKKTGSCTQSMANSLLHILTENSHITLTEERIREIKKVIHGMGSLRESRSINTLYTKCIKREEILITYGGDVERLMIESKSFTDADKAWAWIEETDSLLEKIHEYHEITKKEIKKIMLFIQKKEIDKSISETLLEKLKDAKKSLDENVSRIEEQIKVLRETKDDVISNELPELEIKRYISLALQGNSNDVSKIILNDKAFEKAKDTLDPLFILLTDIVKSKIMDILKLSYVGWITDQVKSVSEICKNLNEENHIYFTSVADIIFPVHSILLALLQKRHRKEIICTFLSFLKIRTGCESIADYENEILIHRDGYNVPKKESTATSLFEQLNIIRETSIIVSFNNDELFINIISFLNEMLKCKNIKGSSLPQHEEEMPDDTVRLMETKIKKGIMELKENALSKITLISDRNHDQFLNIQRIYYEIDDKNNTSLQYVYSIQQEILCCISYVKNLYVDIISFSMWSTQGMAINTEILSCEDISGEERKRLVTDLSSLKSQVIQYGKVKEKNNLDSLDDLLVKINNRIFDMIHNNFKTSILSCMDHCSKLLDQVDQAPIMDVLMEIDEQMVIVPGIDIRFKYLWQKFEKASGVDASWYKMKDQMFKERWTEIIIHTEVKKMLVNNLLLLYKDNGSLLEQGPFASYQVYAFFSYLLSGLLPNCIDNELYKVCANKKNACEKIVCDLQKFGDQINIVIGLNPRVTSVSSQRKTLMERVDFLYDNIQMHGDIYTKMDINHPLLNMKKIYDSVNCYLDKLESISDSLCRLMSTKEYSSDHCFIAQKSLFSSTRCMIYDIKKLNMEKAEASDLIKECAAFVIDPYKLFSGIRNIVVSQSKEISNDWKPSGYDYFKNYETTGVSKALYQKLNHVVMHIIPPFFKSIMEDISLLVSNITKTIEYLDTSSKCSVNTDISQWYLSKNTENNFELNLQYLKEVCSFAWNSESLLIQEKRFMDILLFAAFFHLQKCAIQGKLTSTNFNVLVCNNPMANTVIPGAKLCFATSLTDTTLFHLLDFKTQISFHSIFLPQVVDLFNYQYMENSFLNIPCPLSTFFVRHNPCTDNTLNNYLSLRQTLYKTDNITKSSFLCSLVGKDDGIMIALLFVLEYFIRIICSIQPFEWINDEKEKLPLIRSLTTLSLSDSNSKTDIIFNPNLLIPNSYKINSNFFENVPDQDNTEKTGILNNNISHLFHLVQIFILSIPLEVGQNCCMLINSIKNFFCTSNDNELKFFFHLMATIFKVYIAHKYTYNLRSIDGHLSSWGHSLKDYNTIIDLNDKNKFCYFKASNESSEVFHGTDSLFIHFVEMCIQFIGNVENITDILFRTAGNKNLFYMLPAVSNKFSKKTILQLAQSFKVLIAHNLACKLAITDEELLNLWKKFGVPGKNLGQHINEIYGHTCMKTSNMSDSILLSPSQYDAIRPFFLNFDQYDSSIMSAQILNLEHDQECCKNFKFSLFDYITLSIYTGINLSVCQEIKPSVKGCNVMFIEQLNTTYKPNITHLSDGEFLIRELRKDSRLPLSRENLNREIMAGMVALDHNLAFALTLIPLSREAAMSDVVSRMIKSEKILKSFSTIPVFIINPNMQVQGFAISKQHLENDLYLSSQDRNDRDTINTVITMNFPSWKSTDINEVIDDKVSSRIYDILEHDRTMCMEFVQKPFMYFTERKWMYDISDDISSSSSTIPLPPSFVAENAMDSITNEFKLMTLSYTNEDIALHPLLGEKNYEQKACPFPQLPRSNEDSDGAFHSFLRSSSSDYLRTDSSTEDNRNRSTSDKCVSTDYIASQFGHDEAKYSDKNVEICINVHEQMLSRVQPIIDSIVSELS